MFRIIAIETLEPDEELKKSLDASSERLLDDFQKALQVARYKSVMRILKKNNIFYFVHGYTVKDGKVIVRKTDDILPDDFFTIGKKKNPNICVSAVVGKNGQGKSTLLMLLMRLMNNVASILKEELDIEYAKTLKFVGNIYARLYFEDSKSGCYYCIEQQNHEIRISKQHNIGNISICEDVLNGQNDKKDLTILNELFYSIVLDYSAYAYNEYDYRPEWAEVPEDPNQEYDESDLCWFNTLFHKNDAYQTPIVINPYREEGNIDYNNERDLFVERLNHIIMTGALKHFDFGNQLTPRYYVFDTKMNLSPTTGSLYSSNILISVMRQVKVSESVVEALMDCWDKFYSIKKDKYNSDQRRTMNYIAYKTLKIIQTYAKYRDYIKAVRNGEVTEYVNELYTDRSHITLKLRRAFAYMSFGHYKTPESSNKKDDKRIVIEEFNEKIDHILSDYPVNKVGRGWQRDELWPASSFDLDVIFSPTEGRNLNDETRYSQLSSGMKQMMNVNSIILYHLYNLSTAWDGDWNRLKYRNICLVFDEIELYYHPEYQMKLVSNLIEIIHNVGLTNKIKGIHIILSTHSPFVLSDFPDTNVLGVDDGQPVYFDGNSPFASNVYDILKNGFFLSTYMGDFAEKKIKEAVCLLYSKKVSPIQWSKINTIIENVGDPLLKMHLLELRAIQEEKEKIQGTK